MEPRAILPNSQENFVRSDLPARSLTTTCGIVHSSRGMTLSVAERARAPIIGLRYGLA